MPFVQVLNRAQGMSASEKRGRINEYQSIRDELNDMRTKYAALLAKLDADAGVTDTNYVATLALPAPRFTA